MDYIFFLHRCVYLCNFWQHHISQSTHLWFSLAKRSILLVLSLRRILLVASLLTVVIKLRVILHLLGSSSTVSHIAISSLFWGCQGCCFIISLKASLLDFVLQKKKNNGLDFHSHMWSACLYKRLWLVFSGLFSKTECYFIAEIMYEFLSLPFCIAAWVSETWEFSPNYLSFLCAWMHCFPMSLCHIHPRGLRCCDRTWLRGCLSPWISIAMHRASFPRGCLAQAPLHEWKQRLVWRWFCNGPELKFSVVTHCIFSTGFCNKLPRLYIPIS